MNKLLLVLVAIFTINFSYSQSKLNMELESHISYGDDIDGSGCWGHTDKNGIEYAIIGVLNGIRIYSLEDPKNPIERLFIPGTDNRWREIRTWDDYIYVTTEGPDGVTIIDATQAPENFTFKRWFPEIPGQGNLGSHHSINLDTLGYLYLNGTDLASGAVLLFDLNNDPYNPEFKTVIGNVYTHDCYATADYLFTADLGQGVAIYDIKDKSNIVFLTRFATSSNFAHNAWTSDDGLTLYTTDERSGAYVDIYDITDPRNVKFINKYRNKDSQLGKVIPHNTYQVKNWAVTSWYTDGILITDMTRPDNIVKVGEYDTYYNEAAIQNAGTWFYGCWGVYPFFKSGTIIGSDINSGLWVLKPEYKRASYLEGRVLIKKSETEFIGIPNATVKIINDRIAEDESDQNGVYKSGLFGTGQYKAYVIHPDFKFDTAYVYLSEGNVTEHDFIIEVPTIKGNIKNVNGDAIPFSSISILKDGVQSDISTSSDTNGEFEITIPEVEGSELLVASWGYKGQVVQLTNLDEISVVLEEGYQDDFFADLGWINTDKAQTGNWERAIPIATTFENQIANCDNDVPNDLSNYAYVTGNGGANPGDNDVDNGLTRLESPLMDFSKSDTAQISYAYWFFNDGGNSPANDNLKVYLSNNNTSVELTSSSNSISSWIYEDKLVTNDEIEFTDSMKIICETSDTDPGHLVEGGFDNFNVILNSKLVNTDNISLNENIKVYPTVVNNIINISSETDNITVSILDIYGKPVVSKSINKGVTILNLSNLRTGIYFVKTGTSKGFVSKIVKI